MILRVGGWFSVLVLAISTAALAQEEAREYKRVHQDALDLVTGGKAAQAVEEMLAFSREYPEDAETFYLLTLAHTAAGDREAALQALETALAKGLPAERFLAGPRELLAPLAESAQMKELQTKFAGRPIQGPMVSAAHNSARFWFRTAQPTSVRVVVTAENGDELLGTAQTKAETDFTCVVNVAGLAPNSTYGYQVQVGEGEPIKAEGQRFRTLEAPGEASKFTLAFGGGAGYVPSNERMWNTIEENKPDLLVLLGDNVYSDKPESPAMQQYCYYRRQSRPEFRGLTAHTSVFTIWDDHDFGTNDCWGGPEIEKPVWKRPVWNVYRQNWANPGYGGGEEQPGCWYDFHVGDVHFIMLDGRYYRTNPRVDEPSMLGPAQKEWLFETLERAGGKPTFTVLCSPVPWEYRTKGDSLDTWNGFRNERDEIFNFLRDKKIEGVVLMSADRHRSDCWQVARPDAYDLFEFNSSRLTNQHVHGEMKEAVFSYNKKQSFGLVAFDTTAEDPSVSYSVITIDNEPVHEITVRRSQLRMPE